MTNLLQSIWGPLAPHHLKSGYPQSRVYLQTVCYTQNTNISLMSCDSSRVVHFLQTTTPRRTAVSVVTETGTTSQAQSPDSFSSAFGYHKILWAHINKRGHHMDAQLSSTLSVLTCTRPAFPIIRKKMPHIHPQRMDLTIHISLLMCCTPCTSTICMPFSHTPSNGVFARCSRSLIIVVYLQVCL